ncbi:NAD(P)-dependent dehydrogenase (short-subunit alcohol dehydrogenase family) [Nocardia transvalensis]|uniref:NAD(P)-dependent dehydrogenase (Short-subunit alcohol dehydrogenase family) n=1 Tax=Nocardia transvalensis TaxID=37333 RepID=A0A7W9PAK7_9NOCA|nr:SDR family NAD(P)-dependent oxidoreductase [Nocardia transvalensis]MBB5912164.1 NAD(P)-dependent dehydrogenase (short-subunit alcohol dehydrogenase family) [Nocardia transvalensis]
MADGRERVAIVTGGGGGLGAAVVRRLARRDFTIAVVDLRASWCDSSLDTVGPARAGLWAFGADLRYLHEAEATVLRVAESLGPPQVVVNAPFPGRAGIATELPDWGSVVHARLRAPLLVSRAAERYLAESGSGRIVNLAQSDTSVRQRPDDLVVRETLHAMTETLSRELAPRGVRVNTVVTEINCARHGAESGTRPRPDCCVAAENETASMVEFLVSEGGGDISGRMIEFRHPAAESPPDAGALR